MRAAVFAVGALLLASLVTANVVDTTDATFDEVIKGDFVMMEFYAPWCGHCKKLEPEYEKAAAELKDIAVLAKLDATKEQQAAQKFEIQGFPTIKIFRDGVVAGNYEGGRTAADIVKYVKGNVGPAVKPVASADELAAFKQENKVAVVFFNEAVGGDKFEAFEEVAKKMRGEYAFAVVTDAAVVSAEGASNGQAVMFRTFDEKVAFEGEFTAEELTAFIKAEGVPLFDEIGPHNYKSYLDRGLPLVWVFATTADTEALEAAKAAAPEFKGKLSFVHIDSSKYGGMAQRLGLSADKFPAVAIDNQKDHFALPEGELTKDGLAAFARKVLSGEIAATVRTEEAPAEHTVDGLTTVVGSTFESLVSNADVPVFIEFYAPWCGHCKQLAPTFEAVAKELESEKVRVAKIDATANDFPQDAFPVQGFPTMFFVPATTHKPEQYEGGRSKDDLLAFLRGKL